MLKNYLSIFKLRIGVLIAFSAVVGYIAGEKSMPSLFRIALISILTLMASAGASAINQVYDRDMDRVMKRTMKRPLLTGGVQSPTGVVVTGILLIFFSVMIAFFKFNFLVSLHLFLGAFVYAVIYTIWLKRRSWMNIIVGGLSGSFAVLAGGASAQPDFCLAPILLAVIMFFWTPSHFWSFAVVHREDYEKAGVPMLPVIFDNHKSGLYILLNTVLLFAASLLPFFLGHLGFIYLAAALGAGAFFIFRNLQFLFAPSREIAWKNFKFSMVYLSMLFLAVIFDISIT